MYRQLSLVLLVAGCQSLGMGTSSAQRFPMSGGSLEPAASGTVATSHASNGNTEVTIDVHHLAPPPRLSAEAKAYVAWLVPAEGQAAGSASRDGAINIGQIRVDRDLNGTLQTVTPHQSFDVIVTPEANPTASQPSGQPVLTASIR